MIATKPIKPWAVASLACCILGCLTGVMLAVVILGPKSDTTGVSGGIAMLALGFLSTVFCSLGLIFGRVALGRMRSRRQKARWGADAET